MLRRRMRGIRGGASVAMSDVEDGEDRSASLGDQSVAVTALDLSSRAVQGCEAALRRLATGQYGICADCGGMLSDARLRALPFAEVCRVCQEERDRPSMPARWPARGSRTSTWTPGPGASGAPPEREPFV